MPRPRAHSHQDVIQAAMRQFWQQGYYATSIHDLVQATGTSRHILYGDTGGKHALYVKCFTTYSELVVTPAVAPMEAGSAGLEAIGAYFETQISLAEEGGLPGPGCLMVNALTETAPHDSEIASIVDAHHHRLHAAFSKALKGESSSLADEEVNRLAHFIVTTAEGVWAMSRRVKSATPLRQNAATLLHLLQARLREK